MTQDALFDLDELRREAVVAAPWAGAPLGYTTDFHTAAEFAAAMERWIAEHGQFGCAVDSHMWTPAACYVPPPAVNGHGMVLLNAEGRRAWRDDDPSLPDGMVYQAVCEECRWHAIEASENAAVEAWHDHALPGWRDLPVLPSGLRRCAGGLSLSAQRRHDAKVRDWIDANYPPEFVVPGVPVLTMRGGIGIRHVPGGAPTGGYDVAVDGIKTRRPN